MTNARGDDGEGRGDDGAYRGDRVVVRYRLGAAAPADWRSAPNPCAGVPGAPTQSDITGRLIDDGDPLRIERAGVVESVPRAAITSIRLLSAVAVRNSEIRALEYAAAAAWPGSRHEWIDGWLVRAGSGISRRANSAVPLDRSASTDAATLSAIDRWYAERHLPPLLAMPERLLPQPITGRAASGDIHVLTRRLDSVTTEAESAVSVTSTPTAEWVRAYLGPDADVEAATAVLTTALGDNSVVGFAVIEADGRPIAIGRGALTSTPGDGARWLGLTALWTDPSRRRERLGDAVLCALLRWGVSAGADHAYLQAEANNRVAGNWYRARGFSLHHRYRYISRPGPR